MPAARLGDTGQTPADGVILEGSSAWKALMPLLVGSFVGTLSNNIVNVPLKQILAGLHVPLSLGALVVISFNVTFATLMPLTGWAGDRFGRRRVFCAALVTLGAGAAGAAVAPDLATLVVFRIVEGAGTAAILPNVMAITSQLFGYQRRGRALGLWSAANGLGQALSPLLGGALGSWISWRAIFWPTVPLTLVALGAALRFVPREAGSNEPIEWRGALSLTVGATLLLSAAALVPIAAIGPVPVIAAGTAGLVLIAVCAKVSLTVERPFLVPSLLREPSFLRSSLAVVAQMFCFASILLAVPLNLTEGRRGSAVGAGLVVFAMPAAMTAFAPVSGLMTEKAGPRRTIRVGMVVLGAAVALLAALLHSPSHGSLRLVGVLILAGLGVALVQTPAATGATRSVVGQAGAGIGLFNLFRFAGSALGACWVSLSLSSAGSYMLLFSGCAVAVLLGLAATWAGSTPAAGPAG